MSPPLKLVFLVLVTTFMMQSGLSASKGSLAGAARRVRVIARGLLLMLVIGPAIAVILGRAFGLDEQANAALVLLAVAGVVPLAPKAARAARGDVPFAVVLMLLLSVATAFTASPSARALLAYSSWSGAVRIEPARFVLEMLVVQMLPLAIGLVLRNRSAHAAAIEKVVGRVNVGAFVVVAAYVLVTRGGDLKELGLRGAAAGVVLAGVMAALGWALGGPTKGGRRALAAVVNMPNVALALALVASAGATPDYSVMLLAMFLVRVAAGAVGQAVLAWAHRSRREAIAAS